MNDLAGSEYTVPAVIALLAVALRLMYKENRVSVLGMFRGILVGLFVGYLAYGFIRENEQMSPALAMLLIALSSAIAEDIAYLVLDTAYRIRQNPQYLFDILKGRK